MCLLFTSCSRKVTRLRMGIGRKSNQSLNLKDLFQEWQNCILKCAHQTQALLSKTVPARNILSCTQSLLINAQDLILFLSWQRFNSIWVTSLRKCQKNFSRYGSHYRFSLSTCSSWFFCNFHANVMLRFDESICKRFALMSLRALWWKKSWSSDHFPLLLLNEWNCISTLAVNAAQSLVGFYFQSE